MKDGFKVYLEMKHKGMSDFIADYSVQAQVWLINF